MNDDFYIGYASKAPPGLSQYTRRMVIIAGAGLVLVAALLAALQKPADAGGFEYGIFRSFEGVLYESPLPLLRSVSATGRVTHYILVGAGKYGLPPFARGHDGQRVRFRGSLIQRGSAVMIEMNQAESFQVLGKPADAATRAQVEIMGEVALTGELVDTKCWYGVMRPAEGKVHRACAVRCLSGGVPPGLLLRDGTGSGNASVVLLAGVDGTPLRLNPQWAARRVTARGNLEIRDQVALIRVRTLMLEGEPQ